MRVWAAILVGQLVVNVPVVGIMIAALFLGSRIIPWELCLFLGSILGWVWWSFTVPRWRDWAYAHGIDPARLQKLAVRIGLTWPKGVQV
jgi:hypothetical protein